MHSRQNTTRACDILRFDAEATCQAPTQHCACGRCPSLLLPAWRPAPAAAGTLARLQRRYETGGVAAAQQRNIASCASCKTTSSNAVYFASMRKPLAQKQRSIALVAGAPACPCLPGAQRLPQQAQPPDSRNDVKRAALLRQGNPHGFERWNRRVSTRHLTTRNFTKRIARE